MNSWAKITLRRKNERQETTILILLHFFKLQYISSFINLENYLTETTTMKYKNRLKTHSGDCCSLSVLLLLAVCNFVPRRESSNLNSDEKAERFRKATFLRIWFSSPLSCVFAPVKAPKKYCSQKTQNNLRSTRNMMIASSQ